MQWEFYDPPVGEERIAEVQRTHGIRFPDAFLDIVRSGDSGQLPDAYFMVALPWFDTPDGFGIGEILSFRVPMRRDIRERMMWDPNAWRGVYESPWTSIEDLIEDPPEGFDPGLVAFAQTGAGDLICFDWRKGKSDPDPPIVIWLHEFTDDGPVVPVAPNFKALLDNLQFYKDEDATGTWIARSG
jgi:hypothetical protein